jgi:peptidyl-prolyl cis-trans isomerase SurA
MKKTFLFSIVAATILNAGTLDGIAAKVNDKVITMFEIVKLSEERKISRQQAVELLIEKKLEESELAKQDIAVDGFEVDKRVEQIAASNKLTLPQFKDALAKRGIDFAAYKEEIKNKMARDRLFQKITYKKLAPVDEKDLRLYFENNKKDFSMPATIDVVQYSSKDQTALQAMLRSPLSASNGVSKQEMKIDTKSIDAGLVYVLKNTKDGSFTNIMQVQDQYITFYVKDKKGFETPEFESVKNEVAEKVAAGKEEDAIREYFEKLKASAKIKVLRLPN